MRRHPLRLLAVPLDRTRASGNAGAAMDDALINTLPLSHRLALSYAPGRARTPLLALLALDQRLGTILAKRGEPLLVQIRFAWWRERLCEPAAQWPDGEPLLAALRNWPGDCAALAPLVSGWEALLADPLAPGAVDIFAQGRAEGFAALATGLGADPSAASQRARQWALRDLLLHLSSDADRFIVRAMLDTREAAPALPRSLRPLAVLDALCARALERGSTEVLDGPGAGVLALRVGLFGR